MSSIAVYSGMAGRGRKRKLDSAKLERLFVWVIFILLVVLFAELAYHFVISPRLSIRTVEITADAGFPLSDQEILTISGITGEELYHKIDTNQISSALASIPAVRSVFVSKSFPGTLSIHLVRRLPLAVCLVQRESGIIPVVLDEDGVVFRIGITMEDAGLPVISGIDFPEVIEGMRLPRELTSFLKDLKALKEGSPVLSGLISEYKFVKKNRADYEVLLFPSQHRIRVRIGTTIDERLLKYIMMVLDVITGNLLIEELEEIDFRTGEVVYRIREG